MRSAFTEYVSFSAISQSVTVPGVGELGLMQGIWRNYSALIAAMILSGERCGPRSGSAQVCTARA